MSPAHRPLLLGHRGARATRHIPENTLASFDLCLAHGCDGFEFDVRLTADGEAVVCHDAKIAGLCLAETRIHDLRSLQANGLLPSLESVLERYARHCFLDVELKVPGVEEKVADLLRRFPPQHGCVVSSFLPEVIVAMRAADPGAQLGLIADATAQLRQWRELPVHYVIPHRKLVSAQLVSELHMAQKRVLAWTVNSVDEMTRLQAWGVDGMITDATETLGRLPEIVQCPKLI